jgi:hypothetical protein
LACKQNSDPTVKVNILQAMRSWGYVLRACRKMTPEEREDLCQSLDEMDALAAAADDAADDEPTNITPI